MKYSIYVDSGENTTIDRYPLRTDYFIHLYECEHGKKPDPVYYDLNQAIEILYNEIQEYKNLDFAQYEYQTKPESRVVRRGKYWCFEIKRQATIDIKNPIFIQGELIQGNIIYPSSSVTKRMWIEEENE